MTPQFFIYGLLDPRTNEVRYIGKSSTGMKRPRLHGKPSCLAKETTYKARWIRSLRAAGFDYKIELLEIVATRAELNDAERYWIREAKAHGWRLTNLTDGGDGLSGATFSNEHRSRISAANKGRKLTAGQRARLSALAKARPVDSTQLKVAQMTNAWRGQKHSAETKARIGAAHRGKTLSVAQRAAVSVANSKAVRELNSGRVFASARAAATALSLEYSGVVKVASGKGRLKSHHGYRFEYLS